MTVEEALQHKTYQEAIAGSRMAQREIMKMIVKREAAKAKRLPPRGKVTVRHETDPDNARDALLLLGIVREIDLHGQKRLRLEPWAARAALSRRGRSKLTAKDIDNAKRETADPETVEWPVGVADV